MVAMKTCPSCSEDVPVGASRCKACFHDFDATQRSRTAGPLLLLAVAAGMAVIGAGTFYYLSSMPTDTRILVDQDSRTIQWIRQFSDGKLQTDRVAFDDVVKLEYVITSAGDFQILAVTDSGDRKIVQEDANRPLATVAEKYASLMSSERAVGSDLIGKMIGADVIDPTTGGYIARIGLAYTAESVAKLQEAGIERAKVAKPLEMVDHTSGFGAK